MRFRELPAYIRRPLAFLLGATFLWLVFFEGPAAAMDLNEDWGWPRWQGAASRAAGGALMLLGTGVFLYCSGLFARLGRGTPVPAEPPTRLVSAGLFRFSRNPIYVAYATVLLGEFLWFGHATLLVYLGLYLLAAQAVIVWWEEPVLLRRFGGEYRRYMATVRRWL